MPRLLHRVLELPRVPAVLHRVSCSCCGLWALFCSSTELTSSQGDSSAWRWAAIFNTNLLMAVKANKQIFVFIHVLACVCFHSGVLNISETILTTTKNIYITSAFFLHQSFLNVNVATPISKIQPSGGKFPLSLEFRQPVWAA